MVPDSAGGQLHAVADQIILVSIDVKRVFLCQILHAALGHGERIVAEFQLSGLLANLVHGEVYDPAEFVALLVHMAFHRVAQHLAEHACSLLGRELLSCRQAHEIAGL